MRQLIVFFVVMTTMLGVSVSSADDPSKGTKEKGRVVIRSEDLAIANGSKRTVLVSDLTESLAETRTCQNRFGIIHAGKDRKGKKITGVKVRAKLCLAGRQIRFQASKLMKRHKSPSEDNKRGAGRERKSSKPFKYEVGVQVTDRVSIGLMVAPKLSVTDTPIEAAGGGFTLRFNASPW